MAGPARLDSPLDRDELLDAVAIRASRIVEGARIVSVHGSVLRNQVQVTEDGVLDRATMRESRVEFDASSVAATAATHRAPFVGVIDNDDPAVGLLDRPLADDELAAIIPVGVGKRTPCLIVGRIQRPAAASARQALLELAEEASRSIGQLILRTRDHTVSFRLPDFFPEEILAIREAVGAEAVLARTIDASRRYLANPEAYTVTAREIQGRLHVVDTRAEPFSLRLERAPTNVLGRVCESKLFYVGPVADEDPYIIARSPLGPTEKLVVVPVGDRRVVALIVGRVDGTPGARIREALEGLAQETFRALARLAREKRETPAIAPEPKVPAAGPPWTSRWKWLIAAAVLITGLLFHQDLAHLGSNVRVILSDVGTELVDALNRLRRGAP